jgi:hypothetical protein
MKPYSVNVGWYFDAFQFVDRFFVDPDEAEKYANERNKEMEKLFAQSTDGIIRMTLFVHGEIELRKSDDPDFFLQDASSSDPRNKE